MIIIEHNIETNEVVERKMTAAEEKAFIASQQAFANEQEAKESARKAILDRLGISQDELKAALG